MSDKWPFFASEQGTWQTASPNPHIHLSGTALTLGTYPVQTFKQAADDTTLDFATTNTCTIVAWVDATHWARYEGAVWTDASPDVLDLSAATLMGVGPAGGPANDEIVSVVASLPVTTVASTSSIGLAPQATAPAAGLLSVLAIANGETVRTDKALFDTTNPAALGSVGPGTAVIAARRDHIHANPAIDTLAAATDITTLNATTTAHGLMHKSVAPAAGSLSVSGIANGETTHSEKTIFIGLLQCEVLTETAYQALGAGRPSTKLYFRTGT